MSPEQARGRPVDFRSDVYALGIVLFELLTGRVPFRGESPVATLLLHAEAPPPLDQPGLPAAVVPVLRRALAKAPAERLASAAELATALRDARQALAAGGARRRSVLPIAVGAGGLVVIVTLAVLWGRSTGAPSAVPSRPPAAAAGRASPPVVSQRPAPTTVASAPAVPEPTSTASRLRPRTTVQPAPPPSPEPSPATSEPQATPAPATEPPPTTRPAAVPSATAQPPVSTVAAAEGFLLVLVRPWADVHVDGRFAGQTPLARIPLPPGAHDVRLVHPEFQPFARRVTIREGETYRLRVDLPTEGVRRSR
jgi:serine/threonine-protein kinase